MADPSTEREFVHDLTVLGDMVADDSFYAELYQGLAGVNWTRDGDHISLSWKRAAGRAGSPAASRPRPGEPPPRATVT